MSKTQGAKLLLLQLLYLTYGVPQVKRPYRIGGHPMVIWMWCLSPMDDRDGGPLRADVSLFRFQPLVYILFVCSLVDCYLGFGCLGFGNSRSSYIIDFLG